MAWGIWNKIKNGLKKVGGAIVKGVSWVNDKIVKPIVKPIMSVATPILNAVGTSFGLPMLGTGINAGINFGSGLVDKVSGGGDGGKKVRKKP
jgi:hypothetical protein